MRAVDTNVLARVFVNDPDDPEAARQRPAAVAALSGRVFVATTVVLEFEWVLRGFYELPKAEILRVLRALAVLSVVTLESREVVLGAIEAHAAGLDFADALHLGASRGCSPRRRWRPPSSGREAAARHRPAWGQGRWGCWSPWHAGAGLEHRTGQRLVQISLEGPTFTKS